MFLEFWYACLAVSFEKLFLKKICKFFRVGLIYSTLGGTKTQGGLTSQGGGGGWGVGGLGPLCILCYSPILLTLWCRYLQLCIKESCMYLSSQLVFKTPHKALKIPTKKAQEKCISQQSADLNFKNIFFGVYHGATPQSH